MAGCAGLQIDSDTVNKAEKINRTSQNMRWNMKRVNRGDVFNKVSAGLDVLGNLGDIAEETSVPKKE